MISITVTHNNEKTQYEFDKFEVSIGRSEQNDLVLSSNGISRRHLRIVYKDNQLIAIDMHSINGVYINGAQIVQPTLVNTQDIIALDEYSLTFEVRLAVKEKTENIEDIQEGESYSWTHTDVSDGLDAGQNADTIVQKNASERNTVVISSPQRQNTEPQSKILSFIPDAVEEESIDSLSGDSYQQVFQSVLRDVGEEHFKQNTIPNESLKTKIHTAITKIIQTKIKTVPNIESIASLIESELVSFGCLTTFITDDSVSTIFVDGSDLIWVERDTIEQIDMRFSCEQAMSLVLHRLIGREGVSLKDSVIDCYNVEQSLRIVGIRPPVSLQGSCFVIYKTNKLSVIEMDDLITNGMLSQEMSDILRLFIDTRKNILVCGSQSEGKVRVLTGLTSLIGLKERVVLMSTIGYLSNIHPQWISLELLDNEPNVVSTAFKMRPDRIVIGQIESHDALALTTAMASSHDGVIAGISGDNGRSALSRLVSLTLASNSHLSQESISEMIGHAMDVIVCVSYYPDGQYRISSILELIKYANGEFSTNELFTFHFENMTDTNKGFVSTGTPSSV